jgi:chromosome segregation ATPase
MAYVFYLAFANTSEEKGNKSEKASEDLPERISSTSISNTSISEYTIPQHENSFPTSKLAPVSPEVAAYEMRISNYEKSIDGYKKSISQYERWMSLYRTSETQYDITIDSYRTALTKFESSNKDLRAKLAEIRTAEQERTTHLAELGHRLEELGIDEDELLRKCGMTPRPKKIDADALVRRVIAEAFRT